MIEGQIERCDKQKHIHTATAIQFNQNAYMHCFERCIIMVWRASKQARARISWKSIFLANFHALSRHWHAKEEPQMQKSAMQCMEKFPDGCSFLFLHSLHSIQTTIFSLFLLPLRCLAHKNNYSRQYTIYIYRNSTTDDDYGVWLPHFSQQRAHNRICHFGVHRRNAHTYIQKS